MAAGDEHKASQVFPSPIPTKHANIHQYPVSSPLYMNKKRHKLQYTFQNVACNVISFEMLQCIESEKDFWPLLGGFCGWGWCNIVQHCTTLPPHLTQVFFWWRTSSPTFGHWESKSVKYSSSMIKLDVSDPLQQISTSLKLLVLLLAPPVMMISLSSMATHA